MRKPFDSKIRVKNAFKGTTLTVGLCCVLGGVIGGFCNLRPARAESAPHSEPIVLNYTDTSLFSTLPKLEWGHDPFLKKPGYVTRLEPNEKYKLEGLVYSEENPRAIINSKIVRKDAALAYGVYVRQIGPTYVVIEDGEDLFQLVIRPKSDAPTPPGSRAGGRR